MNAREIHQQAEQAREKGNFADALKLTDDAMLAYQKGNNPAGFAEILASRVITLRHLHRETNDVNFLILAKHTALAAVEIAQKSGDKAAIVLPLYNLGKVQEELGELQDAVTTYQETVKQMEKNPPASHNRPSVIADMNVHLTTCEYKAGDKTALERAERALKDLEQADEEKYAKDVWLSGAHMRLAEILKEDDPKKSKKHLQKAKEIIATNPDLKLRKQQLAKVEASLQ